MNRRCPHRDPTVCPPMPKQYGIGDKAPTLLWLLVLLRGRSRGVIVHFPFTCVLEYLHDQKICQPRGAPCATGWVSCAKEKEETLTDPLNRKDCRAEGRGKTRTSTADVHVLFPHQNPGHKAPESGWQQFSTDGLPCSTWLPAPSTSFPACQTQCRTAHSWQLEWMRNLLTPDIVRLLTGKPCDEHQHVVWNFRTKNKHLRDWTACRAWDGHPTRDAELPA